MFQNSNCDFRELLRQIDLLLCCLVTLGYASLVDVPTAGWLEVQATYKINNTDLKISNQGGIKPGIEHARTIPDRIEEVLVGKLRLAENQLYMHENEATYLA